MLRRLDSSGDLRGGGVRDILDPLAGRLSPKELTVLLKEQRDWRRALQIFQWMRSQGELYLPNPIHYNVVLRALGRAQEWDELRRCWVDMARDGVLATNTTYGILIDVFGKAGLATEALLWLRHMRSRGLFPDEVTMNTAVRVLKDSGEFDLGEKVFSDWCAGKVDVAALEGPLGVGRPSTDDPLSPRQFLLSEMLRSGGKRTVAPPAAAAEEESPARQRPRLAATFNTLIDLYGKAGRLGDASEAFAEMLRSGVAPDATTFNTMMNICGAHGLLPEAEALLERMEERGIRPDAKTFNIFMSLHAAAGDLQAVLAYYRRLVGCGLRRDAATQRILLGALCGRKMVREAEGVIEELHAGGEPLDEQLLPVVMRMYVEEGLLARAAAFLAEHCAGRTISSKNYAAVADVYAERGMWAEAEAVFSSAEGRRRREAAEYNVMIKAYGRAKLYDRACSLFEGMPSRGVWPDECTYNSMIQMLAAGDQRERAVKLLGRMTREARMSPRRETFSAVVASCARAGMAERAEEVFEEMRRWGVPPNEVVYGSLIDALAAAGDAGGARRRLVEMEASGLPANRIILTSLIKAHRRSGDWREAQRVYARITRLEGGADAFAGNCMIGVYADLGMVSEARAVLTDLSSGGRADAASYAAMVRLYRNMGMLGEAVGAAEQMQRAGLLSDGASFGTAMAAFAGAGRLRDCADLLHQMQNLGIPLDPAALRAMFALLKKAGVPPEAVSQLESAFADGKPLVRPALLTLMLSAAGLHGLALRSCEELLLAAAGGALPGGTFACNAAIAAFGAAGETGRALNLFMRMQDEGLLPDVVTYISLAGCYGGAGFVEGLNRIYGKLKHGEIAPNRSLFEAVTAGYRAAGRPDLAEVVEQEMRFTLAAGDETGSCPGASGAVDP